MTDEPQDAPLRRHIVPGDIDDQGYVTVWDHGPLEPEQSDQNSPEWAAYQTQLAAWRASHRLDADADPHPIPMRMDTAAAGHAMQADPERYAMEPDLDDSEIDAEVKAIVERREAATKTAADRTAAIQLEQDRRAAVAVIAARHLAERQAEEAAPPQRRAAPPAEPIPSQTSQADIDAQNARALGIRDLDRFPGESDDDYVRRNEAHKARMREEAHG